MVGVAYDLADNELYAPYFDPGGGNVTVLTPACKYVTTVHLPGGADPGSIAYNPRNHVLYVTDLQFNQIYAIKGHAFLGTIRGEFAFPYGIAYDPAANLMAVANYNTENLTFIHNLTALSQHVGVGREPTSIAFDTAHDILLITDLGGGNVTVIGATHPLSSRHWSIAVGMRPLSVSYNPRDRLDYVSNYKSKSISEVNGTVGVKATLHLTAGPGAIAYSARYFNMFVLISGRNGIWEVNSTAVISKFHVPSRFGGGFLAGVCYDPANGYLYIADEAAGLVFVLA